MDGGAQGVRSKGLVVEVKTVWMEDRGPGGGHLKTCWSGVMGQGQGCGGVME